jgi:hypothetical protein
VDLSKDHISDMNIVEINGPIHVILRTDKNSERFKNTVHLTWNKLGCVSSNLMLFIILTISFIPRHVNNYVIVAVHIHITFLWSVTSCSLVDVYQHFG